MSSEHIEHGQQVPNAEGAIEFGRDPNNPRNMLGSGVLVTQKFALTAAHVGLHMKNPLRVTMDDASFSNASDVQNHIIADTRTSGLPILHPTYGGTPNKPPVLSTPAHPISSDQGMDIALVALQDPITAQPPGSHLPRPVAPYDISTVISLADGSSSSKIATLYGYGSGDLQTEIGDLRTLQSRIDRVEDVVIRGTSNGIVGHSYIIPPNGAQFTEGGDSGGPLTVDDDSISTPDGEPVTVGIHSLHNTNNNESDEMALADVHTWVESLIASGGVLLLGDVDLRRRPDHVIAVQSGNSDLIHVEFGEGDRLRYSVNRPSGAPNGPFTPIGYGDLLGPGARGGQSSDVVGLVGGRLMAIFDVVQANGRKATAELIGSNTYTDVQVSIDPKGNTRTLRLNTDDHDDIVAIKSDRSKDFFYSTGNTSGGSKFAGPFPSTATDTCRASFDSVRFHGKTLSNNSCGMVAAGGTCSCSRPCVNCCPDIDTVCPPGIFGTFFQRLLDLSIQNAGAPIGLNDAAASPAVQVTSVSSGNLLALGTFLDTHWIVTAASPLQGLDAGSISVTQPDGTHIPIQSILKSPDGPLALLRVSPSASPTLSADQRLDLYDQTDLIPGAALTYYAFSGGAFVAASFPGAAALVEPGGLGEETGFALLEPPPSASTPPPQITAPPGSPVVISSPGLGSHLVGVTDSSRKLTVGLPSASDPTEMVPTPIAVHDQIPLMAVNLTSGDDRPSSRYWLEHTLTKGTRSRPREAIAA